MTIDGKTYAVSTIAPTSIPSTAITSQVTIDTEAGPTTLLVTVIPATTEGSNGAITVSPVSGGSVASVENKGAIAAVVVGLFGLPLLAILGYVINKSRHAWNHRYTNSGEYIIDLEKLVSDDLGDELPSVRSPKARKILGIKDRDSVAESDV